MPRWAPKSSRALKARVILVFPWESFWPHGPPQKGSLETRRVPNPYFENCWLRKNRYWRYCFSVHLSCREISTRKLIRSRNQSHYNKSQNGVWKSRWPNPFVLRSGGNTFGPFTFRLCKENEVRYGGYILFQLNEHELGKEIVYYQHSTCKIQEKVVITWRQLRQLILLNDFMFLELLGSLEQAKVSRIPTWNCIEKIQNCKKPI